MFCLAHSEVAIWVKIYLSHFAVDRLRGGSVVVKPLATQHCLVLYRVVMFAVYFLNLA